MLEREALLCLVFALQIAILVGDGRTKRLGDPGYLRRMAECRQLTIGRIDELMVALEARSLAEQRYLDGHAALFSDAISQWAERLLPTRELAVMAERPAELDGVPPAPASDHQAIAATVSQLLADLVGPARSTALDKLDGGRQALAVATQWLRSEARVTETASGLAGESWLAPASRPVRASSRERHRAVIAPRQIESH